MSKEIERSRLDVVEQGSCADCCSSPPRENAGGLSRRHFLQSVGAAGAAAGGLAMAGAEARAAAEPVPAEQPFPRGAALRVKPILIFDVPVRGERTSWRGYGAIHTPEAAREEAARIERELDELARKAEFPVQFQPVQVVPNLVCTKWRGFRGKIVDAPSYPACRSQMDVLIDGDWKRLLREMEGFHAQIVYGDYLREVGYALKKLGGSIQWQSYTET